MKVAVIGKGLSGSSCAYYLLKEGHEVDLFYKDEGASFASSGLMHRFPGDKGEKAFMGDDAFDASIQLFSEIQTEGMSFFKRDGFYKKAIDARMQENLSKQDSTEVSRIQDDLFYLHDGVKVDVPLYLKALEAKIVALGAKLYLKEISSLDELLGYDQIIIAAGFGIKNLQDRLKLKYLKGQSLYFDPACKREKCFFAKGYLIPFQDKVVIGSSYERNFSDSCPDQDQALSVMGDAISTYFPEYIGKVPKKVVAGVRVAHPNYNLPKWFLRDPKKAFITGLGSRGLLYHALYAHAFAKSLNDLSKLPNFMVLN